MNSIHTGGDQVGNLINGIGDARLPHGLGVIAVAGQNAGQLPGQRGTAHGHHALDGGLAQHRHDPRLNGHFNPRQTAPLPETEEIVVVKKQLANQVGYTGIHLLLEVADVRDHVGALRVSLGVTGPGNAEVPVLPNPGHQVIGVEKIRVRDCVGVVISPQRQNVLHTSGLEGVHHL